MKIKTSFPRLRKVSQKFILQFPQVRIASLKVISGFPGVRKACQKFETRFPQVRIFSRHKEIAYRDYPKSQTSLKTTRRIFPRS
jgi:hypothetical protein